MHPPAAIVPGIQESRVGVEVGLEGEAGQVLDQVVFSSPQSKWEKEDEEKESHLNMNLVLE